MPAKHASKCSPSFFDPSRFLFWSLCIHSSLCLMCSLIKTFVLLPPQVSSQNTTQHQILSHCLAVFFSVGIIGGGLVAKSHPTLVIPWTVAWQGPLSMGFSRFSRRECWRRLPFPSPEDLPNPGIELRQADSLPIEL